MLNNKIRARVSCNFPQRAKQIEELSNDDLSECIFNSPISMRSKKLLCMRFIYGLKALYRHLRISSFATKLLGPQYRRSRDYIEIDITYACNMRCLNCNRSITQAPERIHMPVEMIEKFVRDSIDLRKRWKRIRLLGGEPTLHPQLLDILALLRQYRKHEPNCMIEISTNGEGKFVESVLKKISDDIEINNSAKEGRTQAAFRPFNLAPIDDDAFRHAAYENGCSVMSDCGMSLTPMGYYPCAVAGGIDRIMRQNLGYAALPSDKDDMMTVCDKLCRLCGHFRDGHGVPNSLRPLMVEAKMSDSWIKLYAQWREERSQPASLLEKKTVLEEVPNAEKEVVP